MRWLAVALFVAACGSSSGAGPDIDASLHDTPPHAIDAPNAIDARVDSGQGAACGMRAHTAGLTHRSMMVAGLARTYLVYLPESATVTEAVPLVVVFHGYTMSGQSMYDLTEYKAIADAEHVALAFPDGQGGPNSLGAPWNVGANVCPSTAGPPPDATGDDFAFLDAMEADVDADQCVDHAHVYVTGFSMGGYFSHEAGCNRPDVRAVAPHSGGTHDLSACASVHKPIIIFHGTADPVIPEGCDDPTGIPPAGYEASAKAWAEHNGCAATTTTSNVEGGQCLYYDGCPADGQVAVCTFNNMGHCWAGGPTSSGIYACQGFAKATQLEWQFFKDHAW